jgi:hypothetical protein
MQHFPETSIPCQWMNPAAEMQNFAVLFRIHKFQSFDPMSMNGRAVNRSRPIHRCCTHAQAAQPHFGEFRILFLIESSNVLTAAGWDQTAGHRRHRFCAYFQKQFDLSILNILNVNRATHCLNLPPLKFKTTWTVAFALNPEPSIAYPNQIGANTSYCQLTGSSQTSTLHLEHCRCVGI